MSDLIAVPKHKVDSLAEKLTAAQSEIEALRGRVAELEKCIDDGSDAWLLRKQAEAVEEAANLMEKAGNSFDAKFAAKDYAQRLRQQAAESEGGEA